MHSMIYVNNYSPKNPLGSLFIQGGCNYFKKECYNDLYEISFNDFWIHKVGKSSKANKGYAKEGHSLIAFGDLIISIGGCDSEREKCYDSTQVMKVIDTKDEI